MSSWSQEITSTRHTALGGLLVKAARWHGPRDVRIDDVAEPSIGPADALVAVDLATICGSDAAEWRDGPHVIPTRRPHRLTGRMAPVTLGHEFVGRVVDVGSDVDGLAVGDRVCGDACLRCGTCYWCRRGEYNICPEGGSIGLHLDGAFAPLLAVPAYTLRAVPEGLPDRLAAVVEPVAVAMHALRQVRFGAGDAVAVLGLGMVGASAAVLASALGARTVVAVEPLPSRATLAGDIGLDRVLDPARDDLSGAVREATGGIGADVVLDCTGSASALRPAIELARRGGRVGVCGLAHTAAEIRVDRLVYFEREIIGSLGYRYDHDAVTSMMASGRIRLDGFFADPIELNDIVPAGLARMVEDRDVPLRIPVNV